MENEGSNSEVPPLTLDSVEKKRSVFPFPGGLPRNLVDMIIKNLSPEEARICSLLSTEVYNIVETLYQTEGAIIEFRTTFPTFNRLFGISRFPSLSNEVYSGILKPNFKMIGSLKGLICTSDMHTTFIICNPLTNQGKLIPKFPIIVQPSLDNSLVGFGFTPEDKYYIIILTVDNQQPSGAWLYNSEQNWVRIDAGNLPNDINFHFEKPDKYCTLHNSPIWLLDNKILSFSGGQFTSYPLPLANGKKIEKIFSVNEKLVGVFGSEKGYFDLESGWIEKYRATSLNPKEKRVWLLKNGGAVVEVQKNGGDVVKEEDMLEDKELHFIDNVSNRKPYISILHIAGVKRVHSHVFNLRNVK